jgi:hypothetical protein
MLYGNWFVPLVVPTKKNGNPFPPFLSSSKNTTQSFPKDEAGRVIMPDTIDISGVDVIVAVGPPGVIVEVTVGVYVGSGIMPAVMSNVPVPGHGPTAAFGAPGTAGKTVPKNPI